MPFSSGASEPRRRANWRAAEDILSVCNAERAARARARAGGDGRRRTGRRRYLVAEVQPLLLDKTLEAIPRAERAVQQKLRDRRDLRRAVPAVRAVDDHAPALEDVANDRRGGDAHGADVVEPSGAVQRAEILLGRVVVLLHHRQQLAEAVGEAALGARLFGVGEPVLEARALLRRVLVGKEVSK